MARNTGVAVVLSDFLDPVGYETGLSALIGRGFRVNAVQILAPQEMDPAVAKRGYHLPEEDLDTLVAYLTSVKSR